jgi:hypothetical protein
VVVILPSGSCCQDTDGSNSTNPKFKKFIEKELPALLSWTFHWSIAPSF